MEAIDLAGPERLSGPAKSKTPIDPPINRFRQSTAAPQNTEDSRPTIARGPGATVPPASLSLQSLKGHSLHTHIDTRPDHRAFLAPSRPSREREREKEREGVGSGRVLKPP